MHILLQYRLIVLTKYSSGITQIAPLQVFENFRRRTPGPPFQSPPRFARRAAVCPSKTSHWVDMYDYRLLLFAPSIKRYSRNRIASKYHYHASAYSLQTICCRFIYLHEENANADDTDNSSRLPGWAWNPMTAGAQQPISAIAAGYSAVTPPSTLDNGGRPALRKRRRVV